jgi:hypothetical protein
MIRLAAVEPRATCPENRLFGHVAKVLSSVSASPTGTAFLVTNPVAENRSARQALQADSDGSDNRESTLGRMDTNLLAPE